MHICSHNLKKSWNLPIWLLMTWLKHPPLRMHSLSSILSRCETLNKQILGFNKVQKEGRLYRQKERRERQAESQQERQKVRLSNTYIHSLLIQNVLSYFKTYIVIQDGPTRSVEHTSMESSRTEAHEHLGSDMGLSIHGVWVLNCSAHCPEKQMRSSTFRLT